MLVHMRAFPGVVIAVLMNAIGTCDAHAQRLAGVASAYWAFNFIQTLANAGAMPCCGGGNANSPQIAIDASGHRTAVGNTDLPAIGSSAGNRFVYPVCTISWRPFSPIGRRHKTANR